MESFKNYSFYILFFLFSISSCYKVPVTPYEEYVDEKWEATHQFIQKENEIPQSTHINFTPKSKDYLLQTGLYFGLILMIVLVNLFFYINLKDNLFLYYVLLVISTNISLAYHEGLLYPFIKNRLFQYDMDMIFHIVNIISGYYYFTKFLNPKIHYPKLHQVQSVLVVTQPLLYIGYFINYNYFWIQLANSWGIVYLGGLWLSSFWFWKKEKNASFISIAFGLVIFVAMIHIISNGFYIPIIGHTTNLLKISLVIETLVLTYAATLKTKGVVEENKRIKKELETYIKQSYLINDTPNNLEEQITHLSFKFQLTDREADVLLQLYTKASNKEIADKLFISINTVKYHIRNIYEKLDINNRNEIETLR